jgi:hypothetical protein
LKLAPDKQYAALCIAKHLQRQTREKWTEQLKQEVEDQLSAHRQSHVVTEAITIPHTATNGNNCNVHIEAPSNTTTTTTTTTTASTHTTKNTSKVIPADTFKVCGI